MVGQVVGGRYELVELLGEGGMGVVYETADAETGRRVAVKLLSARPIAGDEALGERFRSEAKATAAVVSEHVVQVLDAGRDQRTGLTYIVMELLRGESVRTLLRRLGPLPPQLVVRIGVQIGAGLQKAHETGVVHRDIKPANVFLARTEDGRVVVKLLDFGLAKVKMEHVAGVRGGVPRPGAAMLGSPLYLSPEQAGGRATVDHRTDIWSVGVVLYELLSRRTPHHEVQGASELQAAVRAITPPALRERAPWVSAKLAEVVHGALRLDPAERYQSAGQMLRALRGCLVGEPTIGRDMLVGLSEQERAGMVDKTVKGAAEPAGTEAAPVALGPSGNVLAEQARVGTARGAAAPNAVPPAERTVALPPPLAPPPAPPPAPPGPGRTGRTLVALLVGIVLGVAGTWGFNATFPPGRADAVPGTAPPSALPRPEPSAAPPAETATAGAEVTVLLKVSPSSATVTVDGTLVVPEDGLVEITGKSGSRHKVVLRAGPTETPFDVVIDETGPEPAEVALGSPPASAPAPVGAAPPTPPTGGTPAPAPPPAATPPPASPASVPATSPAAPAPKPAIVATPPPAPVPAVKPTPPAPPPPAKPAPKPAAGDEYE